ILPFEALPVSIRSHLGHLRNPLSGKLSIATILGFTILFLPSRISCTSAKVFSLIKGSCCPLTKYPFSSLYGGMNILPQYKGLRTATQKLFLLNRPFPSAFSRTIFHICSVLKLLETICSNAHFKSGASKSCGAMNFFLPSVILLIYPNGAVPIYRPSFFARRIP